jgi:hypothetical protein
VSWRGRRLREQGITPSLFESLAHSLENFLFGDTLRHAYVSFEPDGEGTYVRDLAEQLGLVFFELRDRINTTLRNEYGTDLGEIFLSPERSEYVRADGLFDLIEFLLRIEHDVKMSHLAKFVDRLFARENQPYEVREGRIQLAERPEEVQVLTGLAALAPTRAIADDIHGAELAFFDPRRDRREEGLLLMARAYDAAKRSRGEPKQTFDAVIDASFIAGDGTRQKALKAANEMFAGISTLASEIVRHGGTDKVEIANDEMKRHLFFAMASTVRLIYLTPAAEAPAAESR